MFDFTNSIAAQLLRELSKIITGKLFTEAQVRNITSNIVGQYFIDWFATPQKELEAEKRIANAKLHITEATKIITSLQGDLEKQATQLDVLVKKIEEKKRIAERYDVLVQTNQNTLAAFKAEMEETVRKELIAQAEKGKRLRRVASFIFWIITLVLGAALGAYLEISFEPIFQPLPK